MVETVKDIRCPTCGKKACEAVGATHIKVVCSKCKYYYEFKTDNELTKQI